MGRIKKYFNQQFQMDKLTLSHDHQYEFYLASMQRSNSAVPLFFIRAVLFVTCVGILVYSLVSGGWPYWLIYMTNWGVLIITITTGLALAVSVKALLKGILVSTSGLPWYIKLYWAWYNIGVCAAFLITIFYYSFLYGLVQETDGDQSLDLLVHGINSVVMFVLVVSSSHPSNLLHFIYPTLVLIAYLAFSLIYYYTGGLSPTGDPYIYPMLDWSNPGLATVVVFGCLGGIAVLHTIVVLISLMRNYLFRKFVLRTNKLVLAI